MAAVNFSSDTLLTNLAIVFVGVLYVLII